MHLLSFRAKKKRVKRHLSLVIPTSIAAGPLGFRTEFNIDPDGEQARSDCDQFQQINSIQP